MENGNGWKIGCSIVLIIFNLILGAVFEPVAPVNAIFFLISAVIFFYTLYKIQSLRPKSEKQETTTTVWKNESVNNETSAALLNQTESKKEEEQEKRSEERTFPSKKELQELLDNVKDIRLKPFFENYIKCYDLLSKPVMFTHKYDSNHPDSEESKLYLEELEAFQNALNEVRIKLGDENSETAIAYKRLSELFDKEDYDHHWLIKTTISEFQGTSFKNAPTFDRELFSMFSSTGCNRVESYCDIPRFSPGLFEYDNYYFYPDFIVFSKDDLEEPSRDLEIIPYDNLKAIYVKIKIKENFIWADDIHDAKRIGSWTDEYGEQRPIYEYGGVEIPALNCTLVFSKASYAKELAKAMNDFFSAPHGNGTAHSKRPSIDDLDGLIGLNSVKEEVKTLRNYIIIQQEREKKGLKTTLVSYHCVFTGNPGTGKTTVARIVADVYRSLGVLKKGHLVETDRSGLVADYVGQTATKTNKIIDRALDGVLFIDEAYSLATGGDNDYGKEAIATLLKRMEDNRDRLVVILAGYSDEMKQFIDSNPGLQSRFNRYIHFPDYNADELFQIFEANCKRNDYVMTDEAKTALKSLLEKAVAEKDKNFGNARFVRNLFEKTLERQANRLSKQENLSKEMLTEITIEDLS